MQIIFISDTHDKVKLKDLPLVEADVLVHCGDSCYEGTKKEMISFLKQYEELQGFKHKLYVSGNHDVFIEDHHDEFMEMLKEYSSITYLEDSEVVIDGLKFYGMPWIPNLPRWAFHASDEDLLIKCNQIPLDTDVLITHGPPYQILDKSIGRIENFGSRALLNRVLDVKPIINSFGHVHSGYGCKEFADITFLNCSIMNENYRKEYNPILVTIENGKITHMDSLI